LRATSSLRLALSVQWTCVKRVGVGCGCCDWGAGARLTVWVRCARAPSPISVLDPAAWRVGDVMVDWSRCATAPGVPLAGHRFGVVRVL